MDMEECEECEERRVEAGGARRDESWDEILKQRAGFEGEVRDGREGAGRVFGQLAISVPVYTSPGSSQFIRDSRM